MKILVENIETINEGLRYHQNVGTPIHESIYRYGSSKYFEMFKSARELYKENKLVLENAQDKWFVAETDLGEKGIFEGKEVWLDFPILEAEHNGEEVELNKPKKGGPKKFYVYVKDGDSVKKVTWGDTTGLKVKINNLEASKAFASRHNCDTEKDKTSARWWACNLPKYAKQLGLSEPAYRYW
ncbi:hypothetical protein EB169_03585 [archaeon]|jgi:hypothetical protein|nr:hypothetical protein [archaeon]NDB54893.1 hypothetical protein [archaeon]